MVEAARERLGAHAAIELGDLNDYVPPGPVAATTVFRAIYYARDRRAFFGRVREYTEKKLVFDLNPRQYRLDEVVADLHAVGFGSVVLRPFFVPQTVSLPRPALAAAKALERSRPARTDRASRAVHLPRRGIELIAEERLEAGLVDRRRQADGDRSSTHRPQPG